MSELTRASVEWIFQYMAAAFGFILATLLAVQFALFLARKLILELRETIEQGRELVRSIRGQPR